MRTALYLAAVLTVACSVAHSYLGERFIIVRLLRRADLPKIFGSSKFTARTLRFAWHITSIAWLGFALILLMLADTRIDKRILGYVVAGTFMATGAAILLGSRGRHLAWPPFLIIGFVALCAARA